MNDIRRFVWEFIQGSFKEPAIRGACLYDRNPASEEIQGTFSAEYVQRVLHDQLKEAWGIYRFYAG